MKNKSTAIATLQIAYIDEKDNDIDNSTCSNSNNDIDNDNNCDDDGVLLVQHHHHHNDVSSSSSSSVVCRIRSFVIDLLSTNSHFQERAKEFIAWMLGPSCELILLGFAFGGDLRQLRNYVATTAPVPTTGPAVFVPLAPVPTLSASSASVMSSSSSSSCELRCLDIQWLLASQEDIQSGQLPGLKRCAEKYFQLPLRKDDQCSD